MAHQILDANESKGGLELLPSEVVEELAVIFYGAQMKDWRSKAIWRLHDPGFEQRLMVAGRFEVATRKDGVCPLHLARQIRASPPPS
eukprot:CAMPEP_0172603222 /NCGR_PEP_ID=MMETSP1068-20121228/23432_1 /TAXON_ID=35684 /ORGANISM="Pseudopedinella elastica, Strain CCMP716" /LENGTH=86 /DNA_ID=CAMNT_0013404875 /DNA_START=99 /DNA_END=360 /DNA_ORIENTATION=-